MTRKNRILPQSVADTILSEQAAPRSFSIHCVTWNLAGRLPSAEDLSCLIPTWPESDMYVICTQECGQSISMSMLTPGFSHNIMNKWRKLLSTHFDSHCGESRYAALSSETLVGLNLIIFVRKSTLQPHISKLESRSIPTGLGNVLGNKGCVAVSFTYDKEHSFLLINSHFHAHQDNTLVRHKDYRAIADSIELDSFDFVIWAGDLNYRVNGNRQIMDMLLRQKQFDIMLQNDQLNIAKNYKQVFNGFREEPITFAPTYKYDVGCDEYDTSKKARIPSWTDRILYKTKRAHDSMRCAHYDAKQQLRISDHRAVFASFNITLQPHTPHNVIDCNDDDDEIAFHSHYKPLHRTAFRKCCACFQTLSCLWPTMCSFKSTQVKASKED